MTFLPIVERELRIAAREQKTYVTRMVAALGAALFGAYLLLTMRLMMGGTAAGGAALFSTLTHICLYGCLVAGAAYSGDSISRENREGTLGLLFLTDLNGYDIILGKLAAGSLVSFYALFATFPVLALPLMLGGITWIQFVATIVALANSLFFAHSLALLISTGHREAQKAISASSVCLWLIALGLPALHYFSIRSMPWVQVVASQISLLSPATAFNQTSLASNGFFWVALLYSHLLGWVFLACASYRVARCWKDRAVAPMGWRLRWRQWVLGGSEYRRLLRRQLLDQNAYFWLVSRGRFRKVKVWITFAAVGIAVWAFTVQVFNGSAIPVKGVCLALMFIFHIILKMGVASESSRFLDAQRRNGELEMLLSSTPLQNEDIFSGLWLAIRRVYFAPIVFVVGLDLLMLVLGCLRDDGTIVGVSAQVAYGVGMLCAIGMLLYDVWCLRWIALWMGLSTTRPGRAAGAAFQRVLILPCVIFFLSLSFLQPLIFLSPLRTPSLWFFLRLFLWVAICVANNMAFVWWARKKFETDLRAYVVSPAKEPLTFLGRIGRTLGRGMRPVMSPRV
jgi:ABC-type transport system involved in multi-copper enzyme maturation permease subunit